MEQKRRGDLLFLPRISGYRRKCVKQYDIICLGVFLCVTVVVFLLLPRISCYRRKWHIHRGTYLEAEDLITLKPLSVHPVLHPPSLL